MANRKKFKCPKCDRRFSMAAHVGRHLNTIHASKTGQKSGGKRRSGTRGEAGVAPASSRRTHGQEARATWGRGSSPASASRVPGAGLVTDLRAYYDNLAVHRSTLDARIAAVDKALRSLQPVGAAPAPQAAPPKRGRPAGRRSKADSLSDFIVRALGRRSKPMSPREIAAGLKQVGYESKTKDLAHAVTKMLPKIKAVRKVGFGLYQA